MYKKMFIIVGLCNGLCGIIGGMEREIALQQLVCKNSIPLLALNNYVIPVSTAYQALRREVSLMYDTLKKIKQRSPFTLEKLNSHMRAHRDKRFIIPITKKDIEHPVGCSFMRQTEIRYGDSSKRINGMYAYCTITIYAYSVMHLYFKLRECFTYSYIVKNIDSLKEEIDRLLPRKSRVYIELSSDDNMSDWIIIKNYCKGSIQPIDFNNFESSILPLPLLELLPTDRHKSDELSVNSLQIDTKKTVYLSDDLKKRNQCTFFCKRIMIIVGAFLSLYLFV